MEVRRPSNVIALDTMLKAAQAGAYAVGSFSPRCIPFNSPHPPGGTAAEFPSDCPDFPAGAGPMVWV